jgi:predicted PurR-regulated permease PerM
MAPAGPFASSWSRWFFAVSILFILYLAYRLLEPFLVPVFLAVVVVVVAGPLYAAVLNLLGGRRALAAGATCLALVAILGVPFFFIASVITTQAFDLYHTVSRLLASDSFQTSFRDGMGHLGPYLEQVERTLGVGQGEVLSEVGALVRRISNLLYANFAGVLRQITSFIIGVVLVVFVSFYLLQDGSRLADRLMALSPLPPEMNDQIRRDVLVTLRATLKGSVVLALIYGLISGLGFWLFGVPNALFWGTVMVFSSVVPIFGTALVWVPAGVYLIVMGAWPQAVGVMVWCLVTMVVCDNWLRPKLIGGQANLHPLLTFFAVLGGITYFGMVGLILGPLVLAILLSLIEVYQRYFLQPAGRAEAPRPAPAAEPGDNPPEEGDRT